MTTRLRVKWTDFCAMHDSLSNVSLTGPLPSLSTPHPPMEWKGFSHHPEPVSASSSRVPSLQACPRVGPVRRSSTPSAHCFEIAVRVGRSQIIVHSTKWAKQGQPAALEPQ